MFTTSNTYYLSKTTSPLGVNYSVIELKSYSRKYWWKFKIKTFWVEKPWDLGTVGILVFHQFSHPYTDET